MYYWMHLLVSSFVFGVTMYLNDQIRMTWKAIVESIAR